MTAQSAPSCVAHTEAAWQALLVNSKPTLTHLDATGGAYGGGIVVEDPSAEIVVMAAAAAGGVRPGGVPANMQRPAWSHSSFHSAETMTSADTNGWRKDVYRIGAVEVSRDGGLRHKSVFGGADR